MMTTPVAGASPATPNPGCRYQPDYARQAEHLCRLGASDEELADAFDVPDATIRDWMATHPAFADAVRRGEAAADLAVTAALLRRACGFEQQETKWVREDGRMVAKTYTRHVPPETRACIFWLKNRRPDLWGDGARRGARAAPSDCMHGAMSAAVVPEPAVRADKGGKTPRPTAVASRAGAPTRVPDIAAADPTPTPPQAKTPAAPAAIHAANAGRAPVRSVNGPSATAAVTATTAGTPAPRAPAPIPAAATMAQLAAVTARQRREATLDAAMPRALTDSVAAVQRSLPLPVLIPQDVRSPFALSGETRPHPPA